MSGPGSSTSIGDAAPDWPGRGVQGDRGPQGLPGRDGADGDPAVLLSSLSPGDALSVDGAGNPSSLPVVSRDDIFPLKRYGTVATGAGADHTALFEAFAEEAAERSAENGGGGATLLCPPGLELRSNGIQVAGGVTIDLQGSTLRSTAATNTTPLFSTAATDGVDFVLRNGQVKTSNRIVSFELAGGDTSGISANISDLYITGVGTLNVADYFVFSQVDFLRMSRVRGYHANRFLVIDSDHSASERSNTQVYASEISINHANAGVFLRGVDKAALSIDIATCSTGFHVAADNHRVRFLGSHVENFGDPEYGYALSPGRAWMIDTEASIQRGITFDGCSALLPGAGAVSGIDVGNPDATTRSVIGVRSTEIARDLDNVNYAPVRLKAPVVWEGAWPFTTDAKIVQAPIPRWNDVVVRPAGPVAPKTQNLLPFSRVSSTDDLPQTSGSGSIALSASAGVIPQARRIVLSGSALERYRNVQLRAGWHTLLLNGASNSFDMFVYVQRNGGDFANALEAQVVASDQTNGQMMRLPFWVPAADGYRFGVRSYNAGGTLELGQVELHQGLVETFTGDPAVSALPAAPSSGVYAVGDRVRNSAPAAAGVPGWVCVTAPATFKAEAALAA